MRDPPSAHPGAARSAEGRIKGAAFREFLNWYAAQRGPAAVVRALDALPIEQRQVFDRARPALGVIASDWYAAPIVHALLDVLTRDLSDVERARVADDGASAVMNRTLRGLYRTLFEWMATPERYAKLGPRLWSSYYDSGKFRIAMPDRTTAICTISDWKTHHPLICDLNKGAARCIYEAMGCDGVAVERTACVSSGNGECRFVTRWKAR